MTTTPADTISALNTTPVRTPETERLELERERLQLERMRFDLERQQWEAEQALNRRVSFAKEHITAIVTGLISFAAISVSLTQIWVANINRTTEQAIAREQKEREWRYKGLEFITHNADSLFGQDKSKRQHLADALIVAFPPDVAASLLKNLQQAANNKDQQGTFFLAEEKMHREIPKH